MDVGDREKVWTVEVVLEERPSTTEAVAHLRCGDRLVGGWGRARRNPADVDQPMVGDELATARALSDLAHRLLDLAAAAIAAPPPTTGARPTEAAPPGAPAAARRVPHARPAPSPPPSVSYQREGLRQAMMSLEEAIAGPGASRAADWAADVRAALYQVSAALHEHLEVTEGDTGLFADVLSASPRLSHAVEKLRADHARLGETVAEIRAELAVVPPDAGEAWVEERRTQITELLSGLSRHRQRGAELTYDAFSAEFGDAD